jgi:hypothetical protein
MRIRNLIFIAIVLNVILSIPFEKNWMRIYAQQYVPFPTDSAQWSVRHTINNPFSQYSYQYKMKGDTLLNGRTYHKIYYSLDLAYDSPNETLHCFVREDITKKIFVKYPIESGIDTTEFMLYNFNLAMGDTVTIRLLDFTTDSIYKLEVATVDSFTTNVDTRKYYGLTPIAPTTWSCTNSMFDWRTGIGSTLGPFYNEIPEGDCSDGGYEVSCFWYKGIYIWGGTYCDYSTGIEEKIIEPYLNVFPNPVQISATYKINLHEEIKDSYLIINDILGQRIGKYNIVSKNSAFVMNTESYNNGIYFYSVYNDGKVVETKKFIISK